MKNSQSFLLCVITLALVGLGCSLFSGPDRSSAPVNTPPPQTSDKTFSDKAVDSAVGRSKIGVPECDEVLDLIEAELNDPNDGWVTKAIKTTVLNRIKDGIRESTQKEGTNTTELAKTCKEFRTQFDKYKNEEMNKRQSGANQNENKW